MINIRPALPEEPPQLKDLWRKCFGDPSAYVDIFFQKFCSTDQVPVDDDGEVDSMAAMLPGTIQLPDGTDVPVGYVYALATNPYMQGQGPRPAGAEGRRRLPPPAGGQSHGPGARLPPSLHRFFEAIGMDECFATRKVEILTSALTGETGGGVLTPHLPPGVQRDPGGVPEGGPST